MRAKLIVKMFLDSHVVVEKWLSGVQNNYFIDFCVDSLFLLLCGNSPAGTIEQHRV